MAVQDIARFDVNIFDDSFLENPYPFYRDMRNAGPVVRLDSVDAYCCARYAEVSEVLKNNEVFISGKGIGFNNMINTTFTSSGSILTTDSPNHVVLRKVFNHQFSVRALAPLREFAQTTADALIAKLKSRGRFDGVTDLARVYPVSVVGEFIGLPEEGRERLLEWGEANFNVLGIENERFRNALPSFGACFEFMSWLNEDPERRLREGGMGRALYEAVDRGDLPREQVVPVLGGLLFAGLDTTVASLANAIDLLGRNPGQWEKLKALPTLAPQAFNEVLRMASPVLHFKRVAARDTQIAGVSIEEGANVVVLFASANRDERKYEDPDRFDIERATSDHLAFGHGLHVCAGAALARLEALSILSAMAKYVDRIEIHGSSQHLNNTVRALGALDVTFH